MKEILSSVSLKTKYIVLILAALFFIFYIILYSSSSIDNSRIFEVLSLSQVFLIIVISSSMYKLMKSDTMLNNVFLRIGNKMSAGDSIYNTIPDGIIVIDRRGKVTNVNKGLCEILGIEEKQIINKNVYSLLRDQGSINNMPLPRILIESLETHKEFRQHEQVIVRDSEVLYLEVSTYMLRNKSNSVIGVMGVVHDFTKRKKLEQQLAHVEKLATAGQMAAELAHEIKNPICSIKGLVQILGKCHSLENSKYYEMITREIDRISVLLQGFLTLTQNKQKLEKINIINIIEDIMPLIEGYAKNKNIQINLDMQRDMPSINADRDNIRQVIVNIVQNGIDALGVNGRMNISIWYDQINDLIKMEFKDNGSGIKQEYLDKIFEPFFTTKDNGTGLGLAISQKIIENHCGKLYAYNNLDGGATFAIELPVSRCYEASDEILS